MSRGLLLVGGLAVAGLALASTARRSSKDADRGDVEEEDFRPGGGWAWEYAPDAIGALAGVLEDELGWVGLPEYLLAVAWTESKGNPYACAGKRGAGPDTPCAGNTARGWYQGRPKSMFVDHLAGLPSVLLTIPTWATATYAWYMWRTGRRYRGPGQVVDWLAMRRGAALPRLVSDVDETAKVKGYAPGERSADVRRRFAQALRATGTDVDFMDEPAYPAGLIWPGIDAVLDLLDAPTPEEVLATS